MGTDMAGGRVLVASNRGPVSFRAGADGELTWRRGGGGVVSGLSSIARPAAGTAGAGGIARHGALWVCAALSDDDRAAVRQAARKAGGPAAGTGGTESAGGAESGGSAAGAASAARAADAATWTGAVLDLGAAGTAPDTPPVLMLDIPRQTFDRAYNAVANGTLWFVHHMLYDTPNQPQFGAGFRADWAAYRAFNRAFAEALAGVMAAGDSPGQPGEPGAPGGPARVAVQDYHLYLVPRMLAGTPAARRGDVRIAHFSHTPWAPADYYRMLPAEAAREVLDGVLGADHAGFLCQRWADAFLDCCEQVLGADVDRSAQRVSYRGRVTTVGVHPLGIDAADLAARAAQPDVQQRLDELARRTRGCQVIVRVDRTELSKNIVRGLAAYRELLVTHPEWRGRVTHVAFAYPSRTGLPSYRAYTEQVQRLAAEITAEFADDGWEPLILEVEDDYAKSLAALRLADVLLVNPIRDGMNLVAKEGPALADHGCALVLSTEAGAAADLGADALLVNPYDVTATARALHAALTMDHSERARRAESLARAAAADPPARWLASQLEALDETAVSRAR